MTTYLDPRTAVLSRKTNLSTTMYNPAGIVLKAISRQSCVPATRADLDVRPRNRAKQFSVPHSASNRSSSGIRHSVSMNMCINPRWITGYVFNRYKLPKLTSLGTSAPHWVTLQTVCSSNTHNIKTAKRTSRVNSGSRNRYDRTRAGLNRDRGVGTADIVRFSGGAGIAA